VQQYEANSKTAEDGKGEWPQGLKRGMDRAKNMDMCREEGVEGRKTVSSRVFLSPLLRRGERVSGGQGERGTRDTKRSRGRDFV